MRVNSHFWCLVAVVTLVMVALAGDGPTPENTSSIEGDPVALEGATEEQLRAFNLVQQEAACHSSTPPETRIKLLRAAIDADPDEVVMNRCAHRNSMLYRTHRVLARLLVESGRCLEATSVYGEVLVRLPVKEPGLWVEIGTAWESLGDGDRALAYYWRAAFDGYEEAGDDPRRFLYCAFLRLCADPDERSRQVEREVESFGDWIAYYHRASNSRPRDEVGPGEVVARMADVVAALEASLDALGRFERTHGQQQPELRTRLQGLLDAAVVDFNDAVESLCRSREGG